MTRRLRNQAFDAVAALTRAPKSAETMRRQSLPSGVTGLFEVLAGDRTALEGFAKNFGYSSDEACSAVEFYVKSIILHTDASPWRVLGHEPGAPRAQLREHMRLLLIWLHPDRADSEWQVNYARRVIDAWKTLSDGKAGSAAPAMAAVTGSRRAYARPWIALPVVKPLSLRRVRAQRTCLLALILTIVAVAICVPSAVLETWSVQAQILLGWIEVPAVAMEDPTSRY